MADHEMASGSPALDDDEEPQAINDPGDPQNPDIEEENTGRTPPVAHPTADTDNFEDRESQNDEDEAPASDDQDSELEELDEREFEDFDPEAMHIPDKPVQVDSDNVGLLGVHKRKRTEEELQERKKKKKEGRREKPKRRKTRDDDGVEGGNEMEGRRARRSKGGAEGRPAKSRRVATPENEDDLTPDERRRRALDRKMDEALKSNRTIRRRAGIDIEAMADQEIESMRQRMAKACEQDAEARAAGQVATHKLAILPQVVELMNRNTIQAQLVDPDINILEAVRFMLEPADQDAALPNYQIQRELFAILTKLSIGKEALIASGIGKVILFYTKSIQPQPDIKRSAEKLLSEWMRIVLKKDKTMRNRAIETREYDPVASQMARLSNNVPDKAAILAERRKKALAAPNSRIRDVGGLKTYSVAPVNNLLTAPVNQARRPGTGDDTFRRIAARGASNVKR